MIVNLFIDVYHSDQFRNYEGTKVSDDFNKTIQMKKSSKFYSMMTVQRFEQQADEITVIAPFYTVIINQNSNWVFFKKLVQFPVLYKIIIVLSTMTYQTVNSIIFVMYRVYDNTLFFNHHGSAPVLAFSRTPVVFLNFCPNR